MSLFDGFCFWKRAKVRRVEDVKVLTAGSAQPYRDQIVHALYEADRKLRAVNAPIRYPKEIIVSVVHGTERFPQGWVQWSPMHKNYEGGWTIGSHAVLVLTDRGHFQPQFAEPEIGHHLLFKNAKLDYPWFRRAGMMKW